MVIRRNCWNLGSVHHPALPDRLAVFAVYFQLKVYMVVFRHLFSYKICFLRVKNLEAGKI